MQSMYSHLGCVYCMPCTLSHQKPSVLLQCFQGWAVKKRQGQELLENCSLPGSSLGSAQGLVQTCKMNCIASNGVPVIRDPFQYPSLLVADYWKPPTCTTRLSVIQGHCRSVTALELIVVGRNSSASRQ